MGFEKIDVRFVEIGDVMTGRDSIHPNIATMTGTVDEVYRGCLIHLKEPDWWINEIWDGEE